MTKRRHSEDSPFVSRGGLKLAAALDNFELDVSGLTGADLGCHVGGFTDCLRQRGAARIYAVDTSYGTLAWKLRQDDGVVVFERTNALHFDPLTIDGFSGCDLVVIDLGWTRQQHAVPAALRWLPQTTEGRIITLVKPQYEAAGRTMDHGVLDPPDADQVVEEVVSQLPDLGVELISQMTSPILGGRSRGRAGNTEYLLFLKRSTV